MASRFSSIFIERKDQAKFIKALSKVRASVRKLAVKKAAEIGGRLFLEEVTRRAPVRRTKERKGGRKRGFLRLHIDMNVRHNAMKGEAQAKIGPTKDAFYALFVEFGTKNASAHPFMRPAFDAKQDAAARKVIDFYGKWITGVLRRHL